GALALLLEQGHPLRAGVQEYLTLVLAIDGHAQDIGVELLGAGNVADVQDEMVDPGGLYHPSALLGFSDPARGVSTSALPSLQRMPDLRDPRLGGGRHPARRRSWPAPLTIVPWGLPSETRDRPRRRAS